jgi:hypothetical protein
VNVNVAERAVDRAEYRSSVKSKGLANSIKRFAIKLVKSSLVNVDAIFKSKDWPYF